MLNKQQLLPILRTVRSLFGIFSVDNLQELLCARSRILAAVHCQHQYTDSFGGMGRGESAYCLAPIHHHESENRAIKPATAIA